MSGSSSGITFHCVLLEGVLAVILYGAKVPFYDVLETKFWASNLLAFGISPYSICFGMRLSFIRAVLSVCGKLLPRGLVNIEGAKVPFYDVLEKKFWVTMAESSI